MKVNGIDIRKYDAKQLTVDVQQPPISVNYEWITGALLPIEFETNIKMGHLKLSVYFKGKNRNSIIRLASEFMANFKQSCDLELDGYKGKYKGFMTSNDYEKTIVKDRHILNLELDGFFYDDELEIVFDGKATATLYRVGSRDVPCIIEIYAKNNLINYTIKGFEENDIVIKTLEAGKKIEWPVLGIEMANVTDTALLYRNRIIVDEKIKQGVVVINATDGSGAKAAGLKKGDVIIKLSGKEIKDYAYLRYELYQHQAGDTIEITYIRDGKQKTAKVKLCKSSD